MKEFIEREVDRNHLFSCSEEDMTPGLFHVIRPDSSMGMRDGLILEKDDGGICAAHLVLQITLERTRLFLLDFGRRKEFLVPVYWARLTYRTPYSLNWRKWYRPDRYFGAVELTWGVDPKLKLRR